MLQNWILAINDFHQGHISKRKLEKNGAIIEGDIVSLDMKCRRTRTYIH